MDISLLAPKRRPIPAPAIGRGGRSKLEERTHPHPQASLQLVVRNRIEVSLQVRVIHRLIPGFLTRPNRVHLRYGSRVRLARLRRTNYSVSRSLGYLSNGQLQGKLLSAYKISQAFPGTPPVGHGDRVCWSRTRSMPTRRRSLPPVRFCARYPRHQGLGYLAESMRVRGTGSKRVLHRGAQGLDWRKIAVAAKRESEIGGPAN